MDAPISAYALLRFVAKLSAMTVEEINGPMRTRMYIRPRMVFAYYAREQGYSYQRIGHVLGERDHSTIINLCEKAHIWRGKDKLFDRLMDRMATAVAEGRVSEPMVKITLPKPKPPLMLREPEPQDNRTRHNLMRWGSRKLLEAMHAERAAA